MAPPATRLSVLFEGWVRGASCRAAGLEGRERAQVGRGGLYGASSGWGLAAVGWDSGKVVPGGFLIPMSGCGCDDGIVRPDKLGFQDKVPTPHSTVSLYLSYTLKRPFATCLLPKSFPLPSPIRCARVVWPTPAGQDMQGPAWSLSVVLFRAWAVRLDVK